MRPDTITYRLFAEKGVDGWIPLGVQANAAILFDPMTKERGAARIRRQKGKTEVYLQIPSGGSLILQTSPKDTRLPGLELYT